MVRNRYLHTPNLALNKIANMFITAGLLVLSSAARSLRIRAPVVLGVDSSGNKKQILDQV